MCACHVINLACVPVAAMLSLVSCAPSPSMRSNLTAKVDMACGGPAWRAKHAFQADVSICRAGQPELDGLMIYDVRGNRLTLRFPAASGGPASCGFDDGALWIDCPSNFACTEWPTALEWASWVAVPYRLTEPTLRTREAKSESVDGVTYRVAALDRPSQGTGTCKLYVDSSGMRPRMACPVYMPGMNPRNTRDLFAFGYEQFAVCDRVQVPTKWSIWRWDAGHGRSTSVPIASVTLRRLRFIELDPVVFERPRDESVARSSD